MTQFKEHLVALLQKHYVIGQRGGMFKKELYPVIVIMFISMYTHASGFFEYIYSIILPFVYVLVLNNYIYTFVNEKGERISETYQIMGLKSSAYNTSWFIINYTKGLLIFFIFMAFTLIEHQYIFNKAGEWTIIVIMFFFMIAMINQAFFFGMFFSKARLASQMYTMLYLAGSLCYFGGQKTENYRYINILLSIFPQFSMTMALNQKQNIPGYGNVGNADDELKPQSYLFYLIAASVGYFVLYIYMRDLIPNDYGTHKSVFYPCMCKNRKKVANLNKSKQTDIENNIQEEDTSSAIYHEPFLNHEKLQKTVKIQALKKKYGAFGVTAVNEVSYSLYEKQIFCLLGHNGCGKTTSISLLTGLIPKTSGAVKINGFDLEHDLEEIRKSCGLCGQKEALFDNYTVEEHLEFMCKIKGIPQELREKQIQDMIKKCALSQQTGKYMQNLSGGNKRKLSLALALIGDSKIIFLDEPSSGLDPSSRRIIWDILKEVRNENRTIVLTTHHLEEAEELADRIGIMAKGKLLTVGTSEFIKKKFGIGFHLKVIIPDDALGKLENQINQKADNNNNPITDFEQELSDKQAHTNNTNEQLQSKNALKYQNNGLKPLTENMKKTIQNVVQIVQRNIDGSKQDTQSQNNQLNFILPFDQRKKFQNLFKDLEEIPKIEINLELNSLEEAFVNIGMDEDKLLRQKDTYVNQGMNNQDLKQNYTDFSNIKIPEILSKPPSYSFWLQLKAIFVRKFYITIKTNAYLFGICIPLMFFIIALVACSLFAKTKETDSVYLTDQKENDLYDGKVTVKLEGYANFELQKGLFQFIFGVGFCLAMAYFAIPIVYEKEHKLKYSLNVMGCRVHPYWIGNYLFDLIIMFFFAAVILCFGIFLNNLDIIGNAIVGWLMVLIPFCMAVLSMSYHYSYRYETTAKVQMLFIWRVLLWQYLLPILLISPFSYYQNHNKYPFIYFLFYFHSPIFAFMEAISCIMDNYKREIMPANYETDGNTHYYPAADYPQHTSGFLQVYQFTLLFLAQAALYYFLTVRKDLQQSVLKEKTNKNTMDDDLIEQEPEITEEEERLEDPECQDIVKVSKLSKQYPNGFTAIKNNNFGVKEGEIFGLLGPNGAGKSTTFNVLTSLIPKSSGSVKLKNIEVDNGIMDVYENVGICPQIDPIWETLTVHQHLKLFGMVKGLTGKNLAESIEYYINVMQLSMYRNIASGQLSGGNKRKLCVTLALIGGPSMQFFDEPSSGLDPIAKRFLWNSLNQNLKLRKAAITITTHSMLEAESLSHKIGILINGRMQCYGSPEFLKKKYGEGYIITIKAKQSLETDIQEKIQKQFPEARKQISEQREGGAIANVDQVVNMVYKVPYEGFSFYQTFSFYDSLVEQNLIREFSVSQSSLEQIFLQLSKLQTAGIKK